MAKREIEWRKRRTRAHLIEDLSIDFLECSILETGQVVQQSHP